MKYTMFTKHLKGRDVNGLIEALLSFGVQGADLCVRAGHPVNPENVSTVLPDAARKFKKAGLAIPVVNTPADFTDPAMGNAESMYGACHEPGFNSSNWVTGKWNRMIIGERSNAAAGNLTGSQS